MAREHRAGNKAQLFPAQERMAGRPAGTAGHPQVTRPFIPLRDQQKSAFFSNLNKNLKQNSDQPMIS